MLENFSDEDIYGDLLDTGYLYFELPGLRKRIETINDRVNRYVLRKDGESPRKYRTLTTLLQCEAITCDDIRRKWRYHGVLLGAPTFCEQLVHDAGCVCSQCVPNPVHPFINWCRRVVASENHVILDTETTGFHGELIELSMIDPKGNILYDGLLKPLCTIEAGAMNAHHITEAMVASAPTIAEEWPRICDVVGGRTVITYNTEFDKGRIEYSLRQHGINQCNGCQWVYECAMVHYANYWNAPPKEGQTTPKWQALETACKQQGLVLPTQTHRALGDCQMTLALLRKVAEAGAHSRRYRKG